MEFIKVWKRLAIFCFLFLIMLQSSKFLAVLLLHNHVLSYILLMNDLFEVPISLSI